MVVIEQLAAEFQIQLTAELTDPFPNLIRLHLQVFFVIKADFVHDFLLDLSSVAAVNRHNRAVRRSAARYGKIKKAPFAEALLSFPLLGEPLRLYH